MGRQLTKAELKDGMLECIEAGDQRGVQYYFNALRFYGASPTEFRGISDAGLSDVELNEVLGALPVDSPDAGFIATYLMGF